MLTQGEYSLANKYINKYKLNGINGTLAIIEENISKF